MCVCVLFILRACYFFYFFFFNGGCSNDGFPSMYIDIGGRSRLFKNHMYTGHRTKNVRT